MLCHNLFWRLFLIASQTEYFRFKGLFFVWVIDSFIKIDELEHKAIIRTSLRPFGS